MFVSLLRIYCILLTGAVVADTAKILAIFSTPSISHQIVFRPVTLELAKRGHEVVVITPDPIFAKGKAPANYTEIDVHDISYENWVNFVKHSSSNAKNLAMGMKLALELFISIFEKQLQVTEVQHILGDKAQKFDFVFVEPMVRSSYVISHILKVPSIQFSSFGALPGMYESVGAPSYSSVYPSQYSQKFMNLNFWDKILEYCSYYSIAKVFNDLEELEHQELNKMFVTDIPTIKEMRNNIDMTFFNIYHQWHFNRPVPPNVVCLGGVHQNPNKTLPKELKSYLDSSSQGVIYMSLGTNVKPSILPRETINIFLYVFATLPYNVIWKWDQDVLEGKPNNVYISKWLPQTDLLHHPNIKLFITQGGLQSTDESITAGVPLIGIPMLADQWFNTEMYVHHKIGVKLDVETLTEDNLMNAINTVVKDNSYNINIKRLGNWMKDQPQTSLERAVWWTEYVLRHGGARHLRSAAANITWTEYLELELVAIVLITLLFIIVLLFFAVKLVIKFIFRGFKWKTKLL